MHNRPQRMRKRRRVNQRVCFSRFMISGLIVLLPLVNFYFMTFLRKTYIGMFSLSFVYDFVYANAYFLQ